MTVKTPLSLTYSRTIFVVYGISLNENYNDWTIAIFSDEEKAKSFIEDLKELQNFNNKQKKFYLKRDGNLSILQEEYQVPSHLRDAGRYLNLINSVGAEFNWDFVYSPFELFE